MNYSLQDLYNARQAINNLQNQQFFNNQRIANVNREIQSKRRDIYASKIFLFAIPAILLTIIFIIGCFTFLKPTLSLDPSDVLEKYAQAVEENPNLIASGYRDADSETLAYYMHRETTACLAGNMLLLLLINPFLINGIAGIFYEGAKTKWSNLPSIVAFLLPLGFGLYYRCTHISMSGFFGGIITLLIYVFVGIPFVFTASYSLILPMVIIPLMLQIAFGLLGNATSKAARYDLEIFELQNKKKALAAGTAIDSKYYNAVQKYPGYMQDLGTVNQLIWIIENGYARDVVEARNYIDRKNYESSVRQQLNEIRKAAERPVEVYVSTEVNVHID